MNFFGIGLPELAVIAGLALVVFGPKRLPELGRSLGKTLKGLQTASTEFEREVQKAMEEPDPLTSEKNQDLTNSVEKSLDINKSEDSSSDLPSS